MGIVVKPRARQLLIAAVAALLFAALTVAAPLVNRPADAAPTATTALATKHYIANRGGSTAMQALGYNLFDTGSSPSVVAALPAGVQALVWLGSGQKCPTAADATFKAKVDALRNNPRVYGYYLSDEPHIADCPGGPAALASRADYIRATSPGHKTMIVLSRVADFGPFKPASSHVDLIGLDPYPCSIANPQCDVAKIGQRVNAALSAGIPRAAIVPVFQAFGQENTAEHYYNLPTATQLRAMLAAWAQHVPAPQFDYTYGWAHQSSSNPTLVDSVALQAVFRDWFGDDSTLPATSTPTRAPSTSTPAPSTTPRPSTPSPSSCDDDDD